MQHRLRTQTPRHRGQRHAARCQHPERLLCSGQTSPIPEEAGPRKGLLWNRWPTSLPPHTSPPESLFAPVVRGPSGGGGVHQPALPPHRRPGCVWGAGLAPLPPPTHRPAVQAPLLNDPQALPPWASAAPRGSLARGPAGRRERGPHGASAECAGAGTLWLGVPSLLEEKLSNKTRIRCFSLSNPGGGAHASVTLSAALEKRLVRASWLC